MKPEQSMAGKTLRAISIVITMLTIVAFSTLVYSAYVDSAEIINISGSTSRTPAITVSTTYHGSTALVLVNITLHNGGFYPLAFSASCVSTPGGLNATCGVPVTTIDPGKTTTLHLRMTVNGVSLQNGTAGKPVDANFVVALEPFVSLQVAANLGGLIGREGSGP